LDKFLKSAAGFEKQRLILLFVEFDKNTGKANENKQDLLFMPKNIYRNSIKTY